MDKKQSIIIAVVLLVVILITGGFLWNKKKAEAPAKTTAEKTNVVEEVNTRVDISPEEVVNKIKNKEKFVLLDVRTQKEYQKSHIIGAILFPLQALSEQSLIDFDLGNKKAEFIVYCKSGVRSARAYKLLSGWGYTNLKNMTGGIDGFVKAMGTSTSEFLVFPDNLK